MIPLPVNPNVVILVDEDGNLISHAGNVRELAVTVTRDPLEFEELSKGKTFKS